MCIALTFGCTPSTDHAQFDEQEIALSAFGMFDLGVVDANGDGLLDVFTSNHSGVQSLLLNRGNLQFDDVLSAWGLEQDKNFPGLAVVANELQPSKPGLYIDWRGPGVIVRSHGLVAGARGNITLLSPVELQDSDQFQVEVDTEALPSGATSSHISFSASTDGYILFRPINHA